MSQNATYKHACGINFQGTTLLFWPKSLVDTVLVAKQMKNAQKDRDSAKNVPLCAFGKILHASLSSVPIFPRGEHVVSIFRGMNLKT